MYGVRKEPLEYEEDNDVLFMSTVDMKSTSLSSGAPWATLANPFIYDGRYIPLELPIMAQPTSYDVCPNSGGY